MISSRIRSMGRRVECGGCTGFSIVVVDGLAVIMADKMTAGRRERQDEMTMKAGQSGKLFRAWGVLRWGVFAIVPAVLLPPVPPDPLLTNPSLTRHDRHPGPAIVSEETCVACATMPAPINTSLPFRHATLDT